MYARIIQLQGGGRIHIHLYFIFIPARIFFTHKHTLTLQHGPHNSRIFSVRAVLLPAPSLCSPPSCSHKCIRRQQFHGRGENNALDFPTHYLKARERESRSTEMDTSLSPPPPPPPPPLPIPIPVTKPFIPFLPQQ